MSKTRKLVLLIVALPLVWYVVIYVQHWNPRRRRSILKQLDYEVGDRALTGEQLSWMADPWRGQEHC